MESTQATTTTATIPTTQDQPPLPTAPSIPQQQSKKVLVIDNGGADIKIGFAGTDSPRFESLLLLRSPTTVSHTEKLEILLQKLNQRRQSGSWL